MTLVLSLIHPEAIIMGADSRKTERVTPVNFHTFEPIGETKVVWSETTKLFVIPGIGCVSMWGDITRAEKRIGQFLDLMAKQLSSPDMLADALLGFLEREIHAEDGGDLGFHVGGYMPDGSKRLFHVFWGSDVGPEVDPANNPPKFAKYDHSSHWDALYNGNHAIADGVIRFLLALQQEVGIVSWITDHPKEVAARFADFVIRYASRVDPTVGGSTSVAMITPGNRVVLIKNSSDKPIPFLDN